MYSTPFQSFALLLLSLFLFACNQEDDTMDIDPNSLPTAAFEVGMENGLTITFDNTSSNASSYEWAFGDGGTSTEEAPTYTYASSGTYTVTLTANNAAGADAFSAELRVSNPYQSSGYVLVSEVRSSAGRSNFLGYFEDRPDGDIDLTQSANFQRLQFRTAYQGFLYGVPSNGEFGLAKYAIDASTKELINLGEIPLLDFVSSVVIIDESLGFFAQGSTQELNVFNPMTMDLVGSVDLSNAQTFAGNDNGYQTMVYNEQTGKLYLSLITNDPNTPQFYDADATYVEVVDVNTQTWEKTIVHPEATYTQFRGEVNPLVTDDQGNTYLIAQGSYGFDGQLGPNARESSRPKILKINSNSEFDIDYAFNPINALGLGLEEKAAQLFVSMVGIGNNRAYGIGSTGPDSPEIQELTNRVIDGTITAAELDQLTFLILFDESLQVFEIDLTNRTTSVVDGLPFTAGFANPYMYLYDGQVYTQMTANGATFNGYYRIDPNSTSGAPAFNLTAGGFAAELIDLAASFQ